MLLKAALLGGAHPLNGVWASSFQPLNASARPAFRAANAPSSVRLGPKPSPLQGYGRLALPRTAPLAGVLQNPPNWAMQLVDMVPIKDRAVHEYRGAISTGEGPVIATLVWYDYPASAAAAKALVNDLDLAVVMEGSGASFLGNGGSTPDRLNSVEKVRHYTCNA